MRLVELVGHRADLYHFTSIHALPRILASDELRRGSTRGRFISLTRNARWWGWNDDFVVRLTLDGETLYRLVAQQGMTIGPHEEGRYGHGKVTKRGNIEEREERINGKCVRYIRSAIKVIDVKRHSKDYAWLEDDHDLSTVAVLAPLQRTFSIPINYENQPLASFANARLRGYLDATGGERLFHGGPFSKGYQEGPSVKQVADRLFADLRL